MKKMNEKRFNFLPKTKGELIDIIISVQIKLIDLDCKLGNNTIVADEVYISKLRERLENLNENSLNKYYNMLNKIVIQKEEEYSTKIQNEQNELLQQLINEYLGEDVTLSDDIFINPVVNPVINPVIHPGQHPHFPWDNPFGQISYRK